MKSHVCILVVFLALVVQASGRAFFRLVQNPVMIGSLASQLTNQFLPGANTRLSSNTQLTGQFLPGANTRLSSSTQMTDQFLPGSTLTANGFQPANQQYSFDNGDSNLVNTIVNTVSNIMGMINPNTPAATPGFTNFEPFFDAAAPSYTNNKMQYNWG